MTEPTAPIAPTAPTAPIAPPAWHSTLDQESQGWVQTKALDKLPVDKAVAELVKGWSGAEKHLGVPADQLLRFPKDGDEKAMAAIYDRLGRPADAAKYAFKLPQGVDAKVFDSLTPAFHKLGLSNSQADGLVNALVERGNADNTAQQQALTQRLQTDTASLRTEWGAAYDKNETVVNGVIAKFGMDEKQLVALRDAMGPAAAMKFLHSIGKGMGEDNFVGGEGNKGFEGVMAPAAAAAELEVLKKDQDFLTRLRAGNKEANDRWSKLHIYKAGSKAA